MSYTPNVPAHIAALKAYVPGLPIDDLARRLDMPASRIAKLASNENPLGASPMAIGALAEAAIDVSLYPDNDCTLLVDALSQALDLPKDWIVVGAGSESILGMAASAWLSQGRSAVYSAYSFQAFVNAVQRVGAEPVVVAAPEYIVDLDALLSAVTPATSVIYIANPGNPTGTRLPPAAIAAFLARVPSRVAVVLDEAYREYLPPEEAGDSLQWVRDYPNLIVTRTFSKAYGLAGLRVGYGIAQPAVCALLHRLRAPFSVTHPAQAAAVAALQDRGFLAESLQMNAQGRSQLYQGFDRLGLKYLPSSANFVLAHVGDGGALARRLETHGLIVRPVAGYGLPAWLRISIGTRENNARLLAALEQELQ
ncbi:histidinol-phosphate transaminase [Bordetella sp. BOR01]|uniref:histidinol-phosphate transaminase n=1 Tax=Bordetella sp. BOR01 TaxID=2854779 RepID=UPI001C46CE7C|nr:histidinol-phosphate transaminase [Bordetella sp. BOR01]MBV7483448.1 histidinol-phosphate transaminase [Bordetella sp. BOR01]